MKRRDLLRHPYGNEYRPSVQVIARFYVRRRRLIGHLVLIVGIAPSLPRRYQRQKDFNAKRESLRQGLIPNVDNRLLDGGMGHESGTRA